MSLLSFPDQGISIVFKVSPLATTSLLTLVKTAGFEAHDITTTFFVPLDPLLCVLDFCCECDTIDVLRETFHESDVPKKRRENVLLLVDSTDEKEKAVQIPKSLLQMLPKKKTQYSTLIAAELSNVKQITALINNLTTVGIKELDFRRLTALTNIPDSFYYNYGHDLTVRLGPNIAAIGEKYLSSAHVSLVDTTGMDDVRSIPNAFCQECPHLTHVDLSGLVNVTSVGEHFLRKSCALLDLDLSPMSSLQTCGNWFLGQCTQLSGLNLSYLSALTKCGSRFLYESCALSTVDMAVLARSFNADGVIPDYTLWGCGALEMDLSVLTNVTKVGLSWMYEWVNVTSLDLRPFSSLHELPNHFLFGCKNIASIDLSPLSNVTSIGKSFLYDFFALSALDLSPLCKISHITGHFLRACSNLTTLSLEPFTGLTSISECFLYDLHNITRLDLTPLHRITQIPDHFFWAARSLTHIDLSPLSNVSIIGKSFLCNHSATTLDLSPLCNVRSIDKNFLRENLKVQQIDLSCLTALTSIDACFMYNMNSIQSIDLSPLTFLTSIPDHFLWGYHSLTHIDLTPLSRARKIGLSFMYDGFSLPHIDLSPLTNVHSVDGFFLRGCSQLQSLDLAPLRNVTHLFTRAFLFQCHSLTSIDLTPMRPSLFCDLKNEFLGDCYKLEVVDLSASTSMSVLSNSFLINAYSLTRLELPKVFNRQRQVRSFGSEFMKGCTSIVCVDLHMLKDLSNIGNDFLRDCHSLTSVWLPSNNSGNRSISLHDGFMAGCTSLTKLDLCSLSGTTRIGCDFLRDAYSLRRFNFKNLSGLKDIGDNCLSGCTSLTEVLGLAPTSGPSFIKSIGSNFLAECTQLTFVSLSGLTNVKQPPAGILDGCTAMHHIDIPPKWA